MDRRLPRALASILLLATVPLLGCPHAIYAIPTLINRPPKLAGAAFAALEPWFVPVDLRFETQGDFLLFHLRVDGRNLEPRAGPCRRWWLRRGAREVDTVRESFCDEDDVRFYLAADVPHTLEFLIGSEHTVAKRAALEADRKVRWKMPIKTRRVELSFTPKPGRSYTIRAVEEILHLRSALDREAPKGTRWDVDEVRQVYRRDVQVGRMKIAVLRGSLVVAEVSAPLYSGEMSCELPFCRAEPPR